MTGRLHSVIITSLRILRGCSERSERIHCLLIILLLVGPAGPFHGLHYVVAGRSADGQHKRIIEETVNQRLRSILIH
jgi:hypothetical protein